MLVTHVLRPRRECATQNAYLIILMKFLARLLTLPLNRQSVRHIFGCRDRRKHETCHNGYCECNLIIGSLLALNGTQLEWLPVRSHPLPRSAALPIGLSVAGETTY